MKFFKLFVFLVLNLLALICKSQEYRRSENWAIGHVPVLRFNFKDSLVVTKCTNLAGMYSGASISNTFGVFQFYDYGFGMADSNAVLLENGLYTNCPQGQILADFYGQGSLFNQTSIILPKKGNQYYVFSTGMSDSVATNYINFVKTEFDVLNYSVVDMDSNNGKGKVIDKNHLLLENQHYVDCALHAVRHSNGKDWWLVKADCENDRFQTFWVQEDTIYGPYYHQLPNEINSGCVWQSVIEFSPDGTQMASTMYGSIDIVGTDTSYDFNRVDLFDFNRCSGAITYKQFYRTPYDTSTYNMNDYKSGVCFSPDGNLLYMSNSFTIYQIDLQDTNRYNALLISGPDTSDLNYFPLYSLPKCAPDGKLYIGNYSGTRKYMSYIDKPNVKGLGCDFKPQGLWQPYTNLLDPPNMPNYGLVSVSAGCEPAAVSQNENDAGFIVYPNPASTILYIQSKKQAQTKKELYNSLGQLVLSSSKNELDISGLSLGLYYLRVGEFSKKIIKE